jgi:hypothetical protein
LAELQEGYYAVNRTYEQLLGEYLSLRLSSEAADEYVLDMVSFADLAR